MNALSLYFIFIVPGSSFRRTLNYKYEYWKGGSTRWVLFCLLSVTGFLLLWLKFCDVRAWVSGYILIGRLSFAWRYLEGVDGLVWESRSAFRRSLCQKLDGRFAIDDNSWSPSLQNYDISLFNTFAWHLRARNRCDCCTDQRPIVWRDNSWSMAGYIVGHVTGIYGGAFCGVLKHGKRCGLARRLLRVVVSGRGNFFLICSASHHRPSSLHKPPIVHRIQRNKK